MNVTPMEELKNLPDDDYYRYVTDRLHEDYHHLWSNHLLSEELIFRTREVLTQAKDYIGNGAINIRAWEAEVDAQFSAGQISEAEKLSAHAAITKKQRRLANFRRMYGLRMRQTTRAVDALKKKRRKKHQEGIEAKAQRKAAHEARQAADREYHRAVLAEVAVAVASHRKALEKAGLEPTEHDKALWKVLDSEEAPYRGGLQPIGVLVADGVWVARLDEEVAR